MSAARIYRIAEQLAEQHRYPEAVALMRHAILQLPEREDADPIRHKLILRMAYLQLLATDQTGDRAYARDAERMLNLYAVRHETLFGADDAARAERGEVFEILYEVETVLEAPEPQPELDDLPVPEGEPPETTPMPEDEPSSPTTLAHDDRTSGEPESPVDTHAGEELEASMLRKVRVAKRSRLADPDDPRVRRRLESSFSSSEGPDLTRPALAQIHGPRPLVRANRLPSAAEDGSRAHHRLARRLGRELLVKARPDLRECYAAAFSRRTVPVTRGTVEASILPDGTVEKARIIDGGVVDGLGDVCVIERIEAARVAADTTRPATRVRLPLTFFYEGPVYIYEGTGETFNGNAGHLVQEVEP